VRYEDPPNPDHDEANRVLLAALEGRETDPDANSVLVGLALYEDDLEFVEHWCVRVAREAPDRWLRGLASLCIGSHLARRFRAVSPEAAALVQQLATDEEMRAIYPQVVDAAEDLAMFTRQSSGPMPCSSRP
jgi:hypothetical protein